MGILNYLLLSFLTTTICDSAEAPNFVIVLTDDQDVVLDGMRPMKNVRRLIQNEGVTFTNSFTTSPICCPSRASFLTGLYVHNHKTHNNSFEGGCNGNYWKTTEKNTFATVLQKNGYNTFYAGKYLNQYGKSHTGGPTQVPPGWTEWHGLVGNSVYYNYTISNNGVPTHSTDLYLTDVLRDLSVSYIENQTESRPFLMVIAPPAPHQPFTPAARHIGAFDNVTAVRHPNFNIPATNKHWLMRMPPSPLPHETVLELDRVYKSRWEALLSVDEMVGDIIKTLKLKDFLKNTYVIYTSDNGYHIGQFSQVYDKRQPYEADIRVPLTMAGPGIEKNIENKQPVINVDLAPTIIKLAGLSQNKMDGKAIDVFNNTKVVERNLLIEYYGEGSNDTVDDSCPWKYDGRNLAECYPVYDCKCQDSKNNTYGCVRHMGEVINFKYCLFGDNNAFQELYNLSEDPYELDNIVDKTFPSIKHWYHLKLSLLLSCRGVENCENPLHLK